MAISTDTVLDWAADNVNAQRRDRAMASAHRKGFSACEACGRAIEGEAAAVTEDNSPIGPTCAKKLVKAGLL